MQLPFRRSMADNSHARPPIRVALVIGFAVILVGVGGWCELLGDDSQEPGKKEVVEIRQGGYVEKVEPGVDYKERLPRSAPLPPDESLGHFHLVPGFRIELAAAEPLICDPVDVTFDEDGRMVVAELTTYSEARESKTGRVSVLEDTDNDGRFDRAQVLVDQLEWPSGVLWFDGGVFVASPPDLLYCKDTDGDGKADVREVVFRGFETSNANQCANSLRWNLDNRVELMPSGGGGVLEPVRWQKSEAGRSARPMQIRGRDLSFEPRTGEMRPESGGSQYGMTLDAWGRKFESANSAPIEMVMYEDRYIARNPYLAAPSSRVRIWADGNAVYRVSPVEPWRVVRTEMRVRGVFSGPVEGGGRPDGYFTSACGVMVCQGSAEPELLQGNAFVCEGASNIVHRMRLEPDGIGMTAHRTEQKKEFLASDEIWFKPVQIHNGPEGALYVVDMYREIYEHPDAVPPSVRKYVDLNAGNDRGRIYRIVPEQFHRTAPRRLGAMSSADLVSLLGDPDVWARRSAARLLYERQDRAAIAPLQLATADKEAPLGRLHAMYALAGMGALTEDVLAPRLRDAHPRVREHAVRLSERLLHESPAIRAQLYRMTDDPDIRVRYQLAFTLGEIATDQATRALAAIVRRDASNRWIRLAVTSSSLGRAGDLFVQLASDATWRKGAAATALLEGLAEQAGRQNRDDQIMEIIQLLEQFAADEDRVAQATVRGLSKGLAKSHNPLLAKLGDSGSSRAGKLLTDLINAAKSSAGDPQRPAAERVQAARALSIASFAEARDVLADLLDGRQPQELQTAALRTLARFNDPAVATLIVDNWPGFTPIVRSEAAESLFSRKERIFVLFKALEDGVIATSQLDPARIQFLLKHPDAKIQKEAQRLLGGTKLARREDVVNAYRDVLTRKGDPARGKAIFKRECAQCHKLQGVGFDLGLPLQNVKSRGPEGILIQILDPNREVNPTYLNYTVLTNQGRMITGVITAETATSVTLTRAEGESDTILRTDIDEMESTNLTIMPEGLEDKVSKDEMADLLAYLLTVIE